MKKKYSWKYYNFKAKPEKVGKELEDIEILGELNSKSVLQYAKENVDSELHKCFEWDDEIAGKKYRLMQANQILCSISIEIKEEPLKRQRVYVNVKSSTTNVKQFKNINEVLKNDDEYRQLIEKAKQELQSYKEKYETLVNKNDLKEIIFEI